MAVLLPDGDYVLRRQDHPQQRDAHGMPVPAGPPGAVDDPVPGAATRLPDGSWSLRLDNAVWPVRAGDRVERSDGSAWVVTGTPRDHRVPGVPDVDYVQVTAVQDPPDVDAGYPTREF